MPLLLETCEEGGFDLRRAASRTVEKWTVRTSEVRDGHPVDAVVLVAVATVICGYLVGRTDAVVPGVYPLPAAPVASGVRAADLDGAALDWYVHRASPTATRSKGR